MQTVRNADQQYALAKLTDREDTSIKPAELARELADEKLNRRLSGARVLGLVVCDLSAEALLAVDAHLKPQILAKPAS